MDTQNGLKSPDVGPQFHLSNSEIPDLQHPFHPVHLNT